MLVLDTDALSFIRRGAGSRFDALTRIDRLKGMKGRPATKDLRIASIALSHDATLVTGNPSDFSKVPMLKLRPIRL